MARPVTLLFLLFFGISAFGQGGTERIKVTDMLKIKSIGGITLSKDGLKAAFAVTSIEPEGESKLDYKYVSQVWLASTGENASPKQLTTKESSLQPAISPDGKKIVFTRAVDGKQQLFLLSLDGGEAVQLTKFKYGAGTPQWSPDGKQIIFSSSISMKELLKDSVLNSKKEFPAWPMEKPGFDTDQQLKNQTAKADPDGTLEEIRAYLENNVTDNKARVINKLSFQDETNVNPEMTFNHFFVMNAQPNAKPVEVTNGFYRFNSAEFTPDGKQLILSGDIDPKQNADRSQENAIFIANADGTNLHVLLGEEGKIFNSPKISPTGKWLAFQSTETEAVSIPVLAIIPMSGSAKDMITLPMDRNKVNLIWSQDENFLYFVAQSNGGAPVYRMDLKTKKTEQLTPSESGIASFALEGNKLVFARIEVADPFELYVADADGKNSKRLSNFNRDWTASRKIVIPEKHEFSNHQGMKTEYWLMKPANYVAGKKFPLLLEIHGGPGAMWGPGEPTMWHEFQYFCSQGFGVVYCNPRGSGGYGLDYLRANIKDWGKGPTEDVLTSLDKTIAEGWADTSKLFITGGSYAGYLVAWIIAHDHRFKAACSQRGVYDLPTFFGEGNAWRLVPNYFGGYPWDTATRRILERESPIEYVQNITTPYIIFHGDNDRRTGFVQSEMLYRSLKVLGRPVEYVRHPGATHEITRSGDNRQRIDQLLRTYEFFERWMN